MPKLKPGTIHPTAEEDAAITRVATQDLDARPYSDAEWEEVKPMHGRDQPPKEGENHAEGSAIQGQEKTGVEKTKGTLQSALFTESAGLSSPKR